MSYEGHGHQIPLALSWPCLENAGRIQRPPLHARLLAEIKSLAICWEAKTSLSAGAYSFEWALMWQSLSEPLALWGEAGATPGLPGDFWWLSQVPSPAAARLVCHSPGATSQPPAGLGHGIVKNICTEKQHQPCKHGKCLQIWLCPAPMSSGQWGLAGWHEGPKRDGKPFMKLFGETLDLPSWSLSSCQLKVFENHYEIQELSSGVCKL